MIENPENHRKDPFDMGGPQSNKWEKVARNIHRWASNFSNQDVSQRPTNFVSVDISFKESCLGVEKDIVYSRKENCATCFGVGAKEGEYETCRGCGGAGQRLVQQQFQVGMVPCPACNGQGVVIHRNCPACDGQRHKITKAEQRIAIPSCVPDGMIYEERTPDGDVLGIKINVLKRSDMTRPARSLDIHAKHNLSLKEALLGCKINVHTIHGDKTVTVKECTSHGDKLRLKDCGAKHPQQNSYGNHIIHMNVKFPESLNEKQKGLIYEVFDNGNDNPNTSKGQPKK